MMRTIAHHVMQGCTSCCAILLRLLLVREQTYGMQEQSVGRRARMPIAPRRIVLCAQPAKPLDRADLEANDAEAIKLRHRQTPMLGHDTVPYARQVLPNLEE